MEQKRNFKICLVKEIRENITGYKIRIGCYKRGERKGQVLLSVQSGEVKEPQDTNIQNAEG